MRAITAVVMLGDTAVCDGVVAWFLRKAYVLLRAAVTAQLPPKSEAAQKSNPVLNLYQAIFNKVDATGTGSLGGKQVIGLFAKSGLDKAVLATIWR